MDNERVDPSDAQHQEAFRKHLERASEIVNGWPRWKQAIAEWQTGEEPQADSQPSSAEPAPECVKENRDGNGKG